MELSDLIAAITPRRVEAGVFEATPHDRGAGVVDAGTLTALMAAVGVADGEPLRSIHATFFRTADPAKPVTLATRDLHRGRSLGVHAVEVSQDGRTLAAGQLVTGPRTESLIEHATGPVSVSPVPDSTPPRDRAPHPAFTAVVGDVDPFDPDRTWEPTWQVWVDCDGLAGSAATLEAYIAFHANEYLVSAAVLPHPGFGMHEAHRGVLTVITSSDVVLHDPSVTGRWLLFEQTSTYAGGGWVYGRGAAFTEGGAVVASFSQQAILRATK